MCYTPHMLQIVQKLWYFVISFVTEASVMTSEDLSASTPTLIPCTKPLHTHPITPSFIFYTPYTSTTGRTLRFPRPVCSLYCTLHPLTLQHLCVDYNENNFLIVSVKNRRLLINTSELLLIIASSSAPVYPALHCPNKAQKNHFSGNDLLFITVDY